MHRQHEIAVPTILCDFANYKVLQPRRNSHRVVFARQFHLCKHKRHIGKLIDFPQQAVTWNAMANLADSPAARGRPVCIKGFAADLCLAFYPYQPDALLLGVVMHHGTVGQCGATKSTTNTFIASEIPMLDPPAFRCANIRHASQQKHALYFERFAHARRPPTLLSIGASSAAHADTNSASASF